MSTSVKSRRTKEAAPTRYELWVRVECPNSDCRGWTSVTWKDRPRSLQCVLCDATVKIDTLEKDGLEYRRRGPWVKPKDAQKKKGSKEE